MSLVSHEKLETVFGEGDAEIAKYKLVLEIPGTYSRTLRKKSVQQMRKNANFKGFRKGDIPPFIRKDVDEFVLHDSIRDILSEACIELELVPIEGDANEPAMDMVDIKSRFKVGTDFQFECTLALKNDDNDESAALNDVDVTDSVQEVDAAVAKS